MKMIKTTMAIAIMASLAGCGNSDDTTTLNLEKTLDPETGRMMIDNMFVEGLPIVKEPKTFTMFVAPSGNDKSTSQDEKHILPILQENTNVHFEL
ncbi:hypothetical protein [Candidatus Epulonipiscium viviparus]|nr:hypothetical protein [Candidatus Epulopiscium viviparus]